ncbi:MAG: hypothetical protein ABL880_05420 [Methylotenera sp.]
MVIETFFSKLFTWAVKLARRVEVESHSGFIESGLHCQFVRVTNHSINRKTVLSEVWFELNAKKIAVINLERPMPYELTPEGVWETWIVLTDIPDGFHNAAAKLARVKLSDGTILKSAPTKDVSERGFIAGGKT